MRSLAAVYNAPMPVIDIAYQHLLTARAIHASQGEAAKHEVLDWAALVAGSRVAAGLDGLDSSKVCAVQARERARRGSGACADDFDRIIPRSSVKTDVQTAQGYKL